MVPNPRVIDGEVLSVVDWPLPPAYGGPAMNGVRRYRLKIYDGNYEVLHKRTFSIDLDLDSPYAPSVLNERLVALTRQAEQVDNEYMGAPRLEVCDWVTGEVLLNWTG
jgi:hypothetical protein